MSRDIGERGHTGAIFRNATMDFAANFLLGNAQQGGLSPGTLLHCFASIRNGDPRSWVDTFTQCAQVLEARARDASDWLAVVVAWRAALFLSDPRTPAARAACDRIDHAFEQFVKTGDVPLERWRIPLGQAELPAWASTDLQNAERLLLVIGGGDTYVEDLWFFGGKAALEHDWPVFMVDLPGQGTTPYQGLYFGEPTLDGITAVFDALHAHGFSGEVVLLGWSGGGIFTTKYATIARPEDRVKALVASTPIHDTVRMFTQAFPAVLRSQPNSRLTRALLALAKRNRVLAIALAQYDWQFGPGGILGVLDSTRESLAKADLEALDLPVLALAGMGEADELVRQAEEVIEAASKRHPQSRIEKFDAWSGGAAHCQVGNLPLAMSRVFEWLEEVQPT